jgi:DNA-binding NarL/FixJ family response regulator
MHDEEQLSGLIGQIYDTTLDPSQWVDVLSKAALFVGGTAASLFAKCAASKTGSSAYDYGVDPHYRQLYFDRYIKVDPTTTGQFFADIERPIATADLIPYDQFLTTRFYREWVRPQGLVDCVGAVLEKSVTSAAMFGVFRDKRDGVVDNKARRRMRLIVPHIRRAVLIGGLIDLRQPDAASFDTLEGLAAGIFLVDAAGRVVHANAAAHAMVHSGDFLGAPGGCLIASDAKVDAALREIFAAAGDGDAAVGVKGIALRLIAHDGERYNAHVLPLTSGARRRAGAAYMAVAALFVHKAARQISSPPEAVAKAYKLTPIELGVLLAIVGVGGISEVGEALGVAESTVKTHVGRLFEKTGARREADLVKLVAEFASPLVS